MKHCAHEQCQLWQRLQDQGCRSPLAEELLALDDSFGEEEAVFFKDAAPKRATDAPTPVHINTAALNGLRMFLTTGRVKKRMKLGGEMGSDWEVETIKTHVCA